MGNEVAGVTNEDGTIAVKDAEGKEVRYAKESDLLVLKESRDSLQTKLAAAEKERGTAVSEAETKAAEAKNAQIRAEADVERLSDEIKTHTGTAEELTKLKTQLETAQEAGKNSATELLELRRNAIVTNYKVPPDTVKDKDLDQLKLFEEALKAVVGAAGGNYAFGGAAAGTTVPQGSPMELAQAAYAEPKK